MIVAHESYLNEILDRALLAPQHEALNMQVTDKQQRRVYSIYEVLLLALSTFIPTCD